MGTLNGDRATERQLQQFDDWRMILDLWNRGYSQARLARTLKVTPPAARKRLVKALAARERGWI